MNMNMETPEFPPVTTIQLRLDPEKVKKILLSFYANEFLRCKVDTIELVAIVEGDSYVHNAQVVDFVLIGDAK